MRESEYLEEVSEEIKERYEEAVSDLEFGKFGEAQKSLEKLVAKKEDFTPAYNKLGVIFLYKKDLEEAEKWLKKGQEVDENFAPIITNLGSLAKKREKIEKAEKLYKKALEINDEYGPAHNNLGVVLREKGNFSESVKHLKKAKKLGSYSVKISDEPFYKRKGCLVPLGLAIVFALLIYLWLS
ncbi:MAG: tetratricopeptide repeat protein [Bacillota bacterium]